MKVHVSAKNIIALGAFANQINALETARHALYTAQIDKYHRVDRYERNKNAQFSAIFGGGWQLKWRFSNFPRFRKN